MIKRDLPVLKQDQVHFLICSFNNIFVKTFLLQKSVSESSIVLSQLCKVVVSIGLVAVAFGQTYSHTLLYLYGGSVLTADPLPTVLLKFHCFAVLLLAVNGVTEGFVFATMNNEQLNR